MLDDLCRDPKFTELTWKSNKYRKWVRDNGECFYCGYPLYYEKEDFITHHHRHAANKDYMLVWMCLGCHNRFHANETKFDKADLDRFVATSIMNYFLKTKRFNEFINHLAPLLIKCVEEK